MIFGRIDLSEAAGSLLGHTYRLGDRVLPKGSRLDAARIARLREAGHDHVVAARLGPGDVAEDEAAGRLGAALLAAANLSASKPFAGRVNLHATAHGLFRADRACVEALNALDEGLTLATLPDGVTVHPRTLLATIKIIPFAISEERLSAACALAEGGTCVRVAAYRARRVGLLLTETRGMKDTVLASTEAVTADRINALGGTMLPPVRCAHEAGAVARALADLAADGPDILLIAVASATMDRNDVGPAAITMAGGRVRHFGMPVDPGNLLCLGELHGKPVLVLPGCARSPALNGIDLCLARLFAGETLDGRAITTMGVGGLLKTRGHGEDFAS